ncbi:MAG: YhcB family protein [Aeromonas sp.]
MLSVSFLHAGLAALGILIFGLLVGRLTAKGKDVKTLEKELKEARTELADYQSKIEQHFTDSAAMLEQLSLQHQNLYQHMASQSQLLSKSVPALFTAAKPTEILDASGDDTNAPPRDYSDGASGLLKGNKAD